jgi:hypothetical protein
LKNSFGLANGSESASEFIARFGTKGHSCNPVIPT